MELHNLSFPIPATRRHHSKLCSINSDKIMCVHGGLSPNVPLVDTIAMINRVQDIPEAGPLGDLVWSDPDAGITTWTVSNRGAGYLFPHQAAK